ncbi:MAG TPA: ATP-binding protein [Terriglobales bacterium]|nr:ATP-binding protein [Terriglobales bacterium]
MRERLRRTRVRLTLVAAGAVLPVAVLAAASFWAVFATLEYGAIDASLAAQAQVLTSALEDRGGHVDPAVANPLPAVTQAGIAVDAVLFAPGGAAVDHSGQVGDPKAYAPHSPVASVAHETRRIDGVPQRMLLQPVQFANGTGVLVLARPLDELWETLALVAALLAAAVIAVVVVSAGLAYWLAGRVLSPVGVMAATARDITEHDLHRRIELDLPAGDELGELAATFNSMLDRLETAFAGLQRFTADAAHELRAPLALMRAQVDIVLRRERTPDEYRASHRALLEEIERLSRMADQLLLLARADAGVLQAHTEPVDLPELLEGIVERWRPAAVEQQVALESELPLQGELRADPELLRRLFDNLLDNALRHTPAGGAVVLSASPADGTWRIALDDTGPGVAPELRPHLFERFARADPARGRETGGAGLGLALSAAIATVHGGSISVEEARPGRGARFVVVLPRVPAT